MIGIIGLGAWGTALALAIAKNENKVMLWGRDEKLIKKISSSKYNNKYLPNIILHKNISLQNDIKILLSSCEIIIIATPSNSFTEIINLIKKNTKNKHKIAWVTKGLNKNNELFSTTIKKELGPKQIFAIIAGPSYAIEVAKEIKTSIIISSKNIFFIKELKKYIKNKYIKIYTTNDIIGTQLGGIIKNIILLALGMLIGINTGENTKAAFITKYFNEIKKIWIKLNGKLDTLIGLACFGDIILGCMNKKSRNIKYGINIAKNKNLKETCTIESLNNINNFINLLKKNKTKSITTNKIKQILLKKKSISVLIK